MITPEMFAELSQQGFALSQKGYALSQKRFAEIELRARTKKALLDRLTEEELDLVALLRSRSWWGTNWEEQEKGAIEVILMARTSTKKPNFIKKIFPFL